MDVVDTNKGFDWLLLNLMLVSTVKSGKVCEEGWWGPHCDTQCRCSLSSSCQINGRCQVNEPCEDGFFGPSCQYVNLLHEEGLPSNPAFLKDNDDNTCNPDSNARKVTVDLRNQFTFTWIRLIVDDANLHLKELKLKLDDDTNGCPTKKWTTVSKVVDIVCNSNLQVKSLTIGEPLASHLCSVYFSGGRNLAVRQNVTMSSILSPGGEVFSVDGITTNSSGYTPCSHTKDNNVPATWRLSFRTEYVISRVRIVTLPEFMNRLAGVSVQILSSKMAALETHNGPHTVENNTLDIHFKSDAPVKYLTIKAGTVSGVVDGRLSLCEVGAFGDSICPKGVYGIPCDKPCSCGKLEVCYSVTGACLSGCQHGFFGADCEQRCSVHCVNSSCIAASGNCNLCDTGYEGDNCTERCSKGRHGINCTQTCSSRCAGYECDSVTGHCDRCPTGRGGHACDPCPAGSFGNNCTGRCPENCDGKTCDRISGSCFNCTANFQGVRCTACANGKYGTLCKHACPINCNKRLCNEETGDCIRCAVGYQGSKCEATIEDDSGQNLFWIFFVFALFPIMIGLGAYYKHVQTQRIRQQGQAERASGTSVASL